MAKMSGSLYDLSRVIGKTASTLNDLEHLSKSIEKKDPSVMTDRMARKTINKQAHKIEEKIGKGIIKTFF